jgi:3-hydroxyisobutyrate dehydrogenase-like beta-hydroxyacid dehydrogenase
MDSKYPDSVGEPESERTQEDKLEFGDIDDDDDDDGNVDDEFERLLNDFIKTKKISNHVGDVAVLKMLRSSYTKTLSALLIESSEIAQKYGLEEEFFDILTLTEGENFTQKSLSRIGNTLANSQRKCEELEEIINCFGDCDLIMVRAALEKLNR